MVKPQTPRPGRLPLAGIILVALVGQLSLDTSLADDSTAAAGEETQCGTYRSTSIYARGRVVAIRGVNCEKAREVAKRYDHRGRQIDGWRCGLAHGGGRALFSCGKGGSSGDLRDWPRALVAKGVGQPSRAARGGSLDVSLKTKSQVEAFSQKEIVIGVRTGKPGKVKVRASFRVGESEERFDLGPKRKRVGGGGEKFHLGLSDKEQELLAFAAETCAKTPLTIKAERVGSADSVKRKTELARPQSC